MIRKVRLTEMEKDRANELRFRTLLLQMLKNTDNNFTDVIKYIKSLSNYFDFNEQILIDIMREILDTRYKPTIDEIIKINLLLGVTIREIADKLNMQVSTVKMHIYRNKYNIDTIILYPRLKREQLDELRNFLNQYYKMYVPVDIIYKS